MKFNEDAPPDRVMGLLYDGFKMPPREELGDNNPMDWPAGLDNKSADPWQHHNYLVLQNADAIPLGRVQRKQMVDHISCLAVRADPTTAQSARAAGTIVQCLTVTPSPEGFVLSQRAGVSL